MSLSVQKATIDGQNGWIVTKDGKQFTIIDKNNDGIFNQGDLCSSIGGDDALSAEDIFNVSYKVQLQENGGKGVSAETMAQYAEYQKAAEERDARQAGYDLAQRKEKLAQLQAAKPQKKSFFEKVMPWLNLTTQAATTGAMVYGAIKGDFWGLGMLGGNWAYNSGSIADMAGLNYTGLANSALWSSQLGRNNDLWASMGLNFTGGAAGLAGTEKAALTAAQGKVDTIIGNAGKASEAEEELNEKEVTAALSGYEKLKADNEELLPTVNNDAFDELNAFDKDEFSEDDKKTINKLKKYPHVPHTAISEDGTDGKLTPKQAEKIESSIKAYIASGKNHGETLQKVYTELSKDTINFEAVKELLKELNGIQEEDV